jgi:protein gp37
MVFVNSMSDLFQDGVSDEYVIAVAKVMQSADWHTYQILTKRSSRMRELLNGKLSFAAKLPHIWWGVSVEDKRYGMPRLDDLRKSVAATRFLSVEPLLEDLGTLNLSGIHWMIVGGESGPGAREIKKDWVESLRFQCEQASIPFFFKQWGGVRKKVSGRTLDGRTYDELPRIKKCPQPSREKRIKLANELRDSSNLITLKRSLQVAF